MVNQGVGSLFLITGTTYPAARQLSKIFIMPLPAISAQPGSLKTRAMVGFLDTDSQALRICPMGKGRCLWIFEFIREFSPTFIPALSPTPFTDY
jgi:hypothetical protein